MSETTNNDNELEIISAEAIKKNKRVPIPTGTWSLMLTGRSFLQAPRNTEKGPKMSILLDVVPQSNLDGDPVEEDVYTHGRASLEVPIWELSQEGFQSVFEQFVRLGADEAELVKRDLTVTTVKNKQTDVEHKVYDLRPWAQLLEGVIITEAAVENNDGFSRVKTRLYDLNKAA